MIDLCDKSKDVQEYLLNLKPFLFDLVATPDEQLPNDPDVPIMQLGLRIMKWIFEDDIIVRTTKEVLIELEKHSADPLCKELARTVIFYVLKNANKLNEKNVKDIEEIIPLDTEGEKKMSNSYADLIFKKGKAEGIAEGIAEGTEEGARNAKRNAILTVLKTRFGSFPEDITEILNQKNDLIALDSLLVSAASCCRLDNFESEL